MPAKNDHRPNRPWLGHLYLWATRLPCQRGKTRLVRLLKPHLQETIIVAPTVAGRMILEFSDYVDHEIILHGCFEPLTTAWIRRHLPCNGTFLDIGAHHGFHTLHAARHVAPHGRVAAFEPWPENFRRLEQNVSLNQLQTRVSIWPYALGSTTARVRFRPPSAENSGTGTTDAVDEFHCVNVDQQTLTHWISQHSTSHIDIAKIDVEGSEWDVLLGWPDWLLPRQFILEQLQGCLHKGNILGWLLNRGYSLFNLAGCRYEPASTLPETNLVAVRSA